MIPTLRGWVDQLTGQNSPLEQRYEAYLSIQGFVRGLIARADGRRSPTTFSTCWYRRVTTMTG